MMKIVVMYVRHKVYDLLLSKAEEKKIFTYLFFKIKVRESSFKNGKFFKK